MTDRAKVIKESEEAIDILSKIANPTFYVDFVRCAFENALALLKEQPKIVRCDECRKNKMCDMAIGRPLACYCDFFCADGEKRDGDA